MLRPVRRCPWLAGTRPSLLNLQAAGRLRCFCRLEAEDLLVGELWEVKGEGDIMLSPGHRPRLPARCQLPSPGPPP